jgi:hypothetical protein
MSEKDPILEVFLKEYDKLKTEQVQRIGFRDNLLYATLGVFVAVVSFALSNPSNFAALLIIPWVCVILGWTYLVNDEKITAIGRYIRLTLAEKVKEKTGYPDSEALFGWEIIHRIDKQRKRRKIEQLVIDEIAFVVSGIVALGTFCVLVPQPGLAVRVLSFVELILLIILGGEIFAYANLVKDQ